VKIVTWNVNSLTARLPRVLAWIERNEPDVVCLQETKQTDAQFPAAELSAMGYATAHHGDGRWNGVAILSRVGLEEVRRGFADGVPEGGCRLLSGVCSGVRVYSAYVPNGRSLDSEHYGVKLAWLQALRRELEVCGDPSADVAVCGDFNIAPDDRDVWDPAAFQGMTHVSAPERRALRALLDWGLVDAFRLHEADGGRFSWWDYRGGAFHQGRGMRIDLVLLTASLAARCASVRMDRDARKGTKPSDHVPVEAVLTDPAR